MARRSSVLCCTSALLALLTIGCENFNSDDKIQPPAPKGDDLPTVRVAAVQRRDISVPIFVTGTIFPQYESKIGPKIAGTLEAVYVDEGDEVTKGQILAKLDQENILIGKRQCEASVRVAQAQLKEAQLQEENLRKEKARLANLHEKRAISQQRYDDIVTAHSMAVTRLEILTAQIVSCNENLAMAEQKVKDSVILAPFSGIIVKRLVNRGEYVTTMPPTVLFVIVNIDKVKTEVALPEVHLARVAKGNRVEITADAYPGTQFGAKVSTINPLVDPVSRTFIVKIEIPNRNHRLKAGMFARVTLYPKVHKGALVVPFKAVLQRDGRTGVFVIDDDKALFRPITVGITDENQVEVIEGLVQDEEIISDGHYGMADNTKVKVLRQQ